MTDKFSHVHSQDMVSLMDLESCCLDPFLYHLITPVSLPALKKPASDSVPAGDIWARMRSGFVFQTGDSDAVRPHLDKYMKHPRLLERILHRGEPYLFHILTRLKQRDLPAELALLPVIESAFDPFATSPAGAAGIWQFMPDTATYVGLEQDWWYDGRRDIIASTEAALDYLERLHKRFNGDWLLTLAAYNAGSARVQRAIRRNREAGKPVDFWHLPLPEETRNYVPKLLALRAIIARPHKHHITLPILPDTRYFSIVEIGEQIDLSVAAQLAGMSLAALQRLNPGYDRLITPPDKLHTLVIPWSVEHVFRERIALLPKDQRILSIRHRIRSGDNLSTIAQQYRTTVSELRRANRLKGSKIITGDLLVVPAGKQDDSIAVNIYAAAS